ncbi:hypothetical protein AB0883_09465 [Micromonospora sp. NPDC047812]|uniref:hypothetical protein n=1 Tax=Micromonospora sp. NPDC047812 TaxID=3155742 RepID=UPI0034531291
MNIRRWSVGVLAATLLVPGLAACKSDGPAPADAGSATSAVPADPKEALLASTKEIEKGNFNFTIAGGGVNGQGSVHKPSNSAQFTMKVDDGSGTTFGMEMIYIEPDSWVKMDLGELGAMIPGADKMKGKYQHLDQSKVKDGGDLALNMKDLDPAGTAVLAKGISEVQKTAEGSYAGKLDASAVGDGSAALDSDLVKALGPQAKSLPFTAKLDAEGRLTELVISVPAAGDTKAHDIKVAYADYGKATTPQKPPADQVVEAPASTYEMLK